MPESIITIERVQKQAIDAAQKYDCVNDACPYSFYTQAGRVFKAAFQKERMAINSQAAKAIREPAAP